MTEFDLKDSGARQEFETGARRDLQEGKGRPDLISTIFKQRLAVVMEKGAAKYGDRNWELGIPLSRFASSAMRHLDQAFEGLEDEDHLGQAAFNIMGWMHTNELIRRGLLPSSLDDLPLLIDNGLISFDDAKPYVVGNKRFATLKEADEEVTRKADIDAAEQYIKDYSPVIGVTPPDEGFIVGPLEIKEERDEGKEALKNAGLVEGLDGVWRGDTKIDESVAPDALRETPICGPPPALTKDFPAQPTPDHIRYPGQKYPGQRPEGAGAAHRGLVEDA